MKLSRLRVSWEFHQECKTRESGSSSSVTSSAKTEWGFDVVVIRMYRIKERSEVVLMKVLGILMTIFVCSSKSLAKERLALEQRRSNERKSGT